MSDYGDETQEKRTVSGLNYARVDKPDLPETVNHPQHYGGDTPYEVIKVARAWGLNKNACLFMVLKYIGRDPELKAAAVSGTLGDQRSNSRAAARVRINDLKKAAWYLNDEIEALEKENQTT